MRTAPLGTNGNPTTIRLLGAGKTPVQAGVIETGAGRPVVFLHGLVGLNEHWEGVVERISHRVRCVLFELPLLELRGDDLAGSAHVVSLLGQLREVLGGFPL